MSDLSQSALGKPSAYPDQYDPRQLFALSREAQRRQLADALDLPSLPAFQGADIWNAYEVSWLDTHGKPEVACAVLEVPADSPCIIESKSFKLYLGSFNQTRFGSADEVKNHILDDISSQVEAPVNCGLHSMQEGSSLQTGEMDGLCIDGLEVRVEDYQPNPQLLRAKGENVDETLYSNLFRSLCPVTGQPDYASVQIRYRGPLIDHASLLQYLISYRRHHGFHEQCVERIFVELLNRCTPEDLSVFARFTRRGGIDISPFRTTGVSSDFPAPVPVRTLRQ